MDNKADLEYYRTVARTQSNPEILKAELFDLTKEVEYERENATDCTNKGERAMPMVDMFLGKPVDYWYGLQERVNEKGLEDTMEELVTLRAKISYYESRIQQLFNMMQFKLEIKDVKKTME